MNLWLEADALLNECACSRGFFWDGLSTAASAYKFCILSELKLTHAFSSHIIHRVSLLKYQ